VTPESDDSLDRSQPLLFISHRSADREIADVIREFITFRSGGSVLVYQTSSSDAQAPKIGRNVNRELMRALWETDVLLLVYTTKEKDWDYCMWECGVATHEASEATNVIVLQCGSQLPRVFADQVGVDVRDFERVRRFVNSFLTDRDFFPDRDTPVTRFQPNDANVEKAAQELYEQLESVIPVDTGGQVEEWPAVPFVRLGLTAGQVRQIADEEDGDRALLRAAAMLLESSVVASDREAAALFGKPTLPADEAFGRVFARSLRQGETPDWLRSLAEQVCQAAQWNFPTVRWGLMRSANQNDGTWYSPVLTHVRRLPNKSMQFDVHFQRFACATGASAVELALPQDTLRAVSGSGG
jgi:hypothetical protein